MKITIETGSNIIFYDGVCGLCNRFNHQVLRHDPDGVFIFAKLQSDLAVETLARRGQDASKLNTVYVLTDYGTDKEKVHMKSRAVLAIASRLGGWRKFLANIAKLLPGPISDLIYDLVARNRYKIFGKLEQCPMPPAGTAQRFIDL